MPLCVRHRRAVRAHCLRRIEALDAGLGAFITVGTMLAGRPADEVTLVSLSAQLEEARPWAGRHPAAWGSTAG